ncbi:3-keto-disaccharide hydrolase [Flavicella sediminum]|uniref:3-keto-disaccharide hydrolase n=1 Tax=Flavicella sediminum TaxID=2585141 RepID=UPI00111E5BF2|nr:DUF1080 domain-containing protein [Flavicella sediminum]
MIKNKKLLILSASFVLALFVFKYFEETPEDKSGWKTLFNGENLDGWNIKIHHHEYNDNYANTFKVSDGKLVVDYSEYTTFDDRFGHIFYKEPFSSYHLKFETRFKEQWLEDAPYHTYRNSGVMFHSQDPRTILKDQNWPISVEYQILAEREAGVERPTANMCSPSTEVIFNDELAKKHCVISTSKTFQWDEWQKGELIVYGDSLVIHKVNGLEVLRYSKPHIGGNMNAKGADPKFSIAGTPLKSGYIAFQAEGHAVEFKNIEIKELH